MPAAMEGIDPAVAFNMSHNPAYTMSGLCSIGGIIGFARTGSIPSIAAGIFVGALYGWSAYQIQQGDPNVGLRWAFASSVILAASSLPRARKGPVPAILTLAGTAAAAYYGKAMRDLHIAPF